VNNHTREAIEGFQATNTERLGDMKGYSYYVQLGFWPLGNRDLNGGPPGYFKPTHLDLTKPDEDPKRALQLLVKWEQLHVKYSSASRQSSTPDANNIDGTIKVNVLELGANYWATKNIRFSANWAFDMFPGSEPVDPTTDGGPKQGPDQRAIAPAQTLPKDTKETGARDEGHVLHEILFRVAAAI
jgi:hypothetical protein